jgi:uncharacterized damage-inducible protein DinB
MNDSVLRTHLVRLLSWEDAHVSFDTAVAGLPAEARGRRAAGLPHSPWELVEHMRVTQRDILDFCAGDEYRELEWPADYWPAAGSAPSAPEWEASVAGYRSDRAALAALAGEAELLAVVPHGSDQTYLRELLLAADHAAYHVGQLVLVRRALGVWAGR